jgi:ribose transport system ATP-binding protein
VTASAPESEVVLAMRGIEKRFGAMRALAGVDLTVNKGEVHALIGENGAGKSTLMKVVSGAIGADAGTMLLGGEPYAPRDPLSAREHGVCMIYQELTLALHLTVCENLFLGRELTRFGLRDRAAMSARAERALAFLAQPELTPERVVAELSPGARQLVEIARALVFDARVVVMDEPTSSLSQRDVERLFAIIERLAASGVAVIYISHFLEEVRRVAQRYTVLRDGASVAGGEVPRAQDQAQRFEREVLSAMAGRAPGEAYPRVPHRAGEVRLSVREMSGVPLPRAASFALLRGEILGIFGLVGAGRSELLRALFGLDRAQHGQVRFARDARGPARFDLGRLHASPWQRLRDGLGMLSENRKEEGLALDLSIAQNLTLSRPAARLGVLMPEAARAATEGLGQRVSLRYRDADQPLRELSGGNQQKVALLRLLHHDVDVYLLDEPTRGIDVASKAEIYRLLGELAAQGKSVLMVSSYLPELLGVCDRIAVMARGVLSEPRPVAAWSSESLLAAATASEGAQEAAS